MRPTVLLAGCGDLGTETGLRFVDAGWHAIGLRRAAHRLPTAIEGVAADLTGDLGPVVDALPARLDALVHAPTAAERTADAYRAVYVDGLARLLDTLEAAGRAPHRVLVVSSTAVYDVTDGSTVDEDIPVQPTTETARALVEAEHALHARRPDGIALRLAGIYGPGRTRLIDAVREGRARLPESPVTTNRIHRDDAAAAIVHLVTAVVDPAPCYLGVDDTPADLGEVLRFLAAELGLPEPPVGPVERTRGGHKVCRNDRLVATGFRCTYTSYREGYRAILAGTGVRHP